MYICAVFNIKAFRMSIQYKDKPLNIYRASAGSGKTHLLTGFFIKQLFLPELLPETHSGEMHFSEVLAVTFTNKATAEMKGRIIDELYKLSQSPTESDYWNDVSQSGKKSEAAIRKKASGLLVQILNEYSSFNISTIDSFFQKIVRSFARELNVPGNYEVELNSELAIEAAVTNFLDKLDSRLNNSLFKWMERFSDKRVEEGESWDLRGKLSEIAVKVLNSEAYRKHSQQIKDFTDDKHELAHYEQMLSNIIRDWKKQLCEIGKRGLEIIQQYGIEEDEFAYKGSGSVSLFSPWAEGKEKEPGGRFTDIINNPDKLFKKTSPRYGSEVQHAIIELMEAGCQLYTGETYTNYVTAIYIQQDLYELGIVANIDEELKEYCNEHNLMLLNSTTELLSKLIGPYDAPFVYEKTGTHLKSYMIDEFQDTSDMQWSNFKPLISNTLSQGYQNLIVGDVKQSIYRWRGSDWSLLDSQLSHYEPLSHNDNDEALRTNWRSLPSIVDFNNKFFQAAAKELDTIASTDQIKRIYRDISQGLPAKRTEAGKPQGLVHVEYLRPKDEEGNVIEKPNTESLLNEAKQQLPLQIIALQQHGFEPRDIAILCRRKRECRIMAEALLQYQQEHPECPYPMDIISSEALQIGARPVIQTLISMMQLLLNPDSELQQAVTWSNYLQLEGHSPEEAIQQYFRMTADQQELLPQIAFRPLYELTELLITLLPQQIVSQEAPFLQAFRDIVLEFCHSHNADLSVFLEWWEETGHDKSITTPEAMNAIQIMTIHKSKGLGMPAVIIPFASWEMDIEINPTRKQIIWCEPTEEPFRRDILLPIRLDKRLQDTIFKEEYAEERLRTIIDNLNTAYVAFTRAKEAMIILSPVPNGKEGSRLEHLLDHFCQEKTFGEWQRSIKKEDQPSESAEPIQFDEIASNPSNHLPELSILHSPLQEDNTARKKGNCIHRVLQEICHAGEHELVVHKLYQKGIIDPRIINEREMTSIISHLLSLPEVSPWFSPELQVMNEQTIMDKFGNQIRPDRIIRDAEGTVTVIDYKTGSDHTGYRKQVKSYMNALRDIGFKKVKGFLFFLKEERIVQVL